MCVEGMVEGVKIGWLVDAGRSITILSLREYSKILIFQRLALERCTRKLYQTKRGPMRVEGQVAVRISVVEFRIRHNIVMVDCGDEGIHGVDVLTHGGALIHLAMRTLSLGGLKIPL